MAVVKESAVAEQDGGPPTGPSGEPPDFMEQIIGGAVATLQREAPDWYRAGGEHADTIAANAARMALWLGGMRPGGLRVIRLLGGYEVELTPQDPLGFVQHLMQALVGEVTSGEEPPSPEQAGQKLAIEIGNAINQVTPDIAPFVLRALFWQLCGGLLQQTLQQQAEEQELAARRGSGKREGPPDAEETTDEPGHSPTEPSEAADSPRPRLFRPGQPEEDGPPPPLIFPGRR